MTDFSLSKPKVVQFVRWTAEADARVREGVARGELRSVTAAALNVSVTILQNRVRALNLSRPLNGTIRKAPVTYRPAGASMEGGCRFYKGDPKTSSACGEKRQFGSAYCPEHHARCYDTSRSYHRL